MNQPHLVSGAIEPLSISPSERIAELEREVADLKRQLGEAQQRIKELETPLKKGKGIPGVTFRKIVPGSARG